MTSGISAKILLNQKQIEAVTEYVMSFFDQKTQAVKINQEGREIFRTECVVCHAQTGQGDRSIGAPNLTDAVWLYGKSKEDTIPKGCYVEFSLVYIVSQQICEEKRSLHWPSRLQELLQRTGISSLFLLLS